MTIPWVKWSTFYTAQRTFLLRHEMYKTKPMLKLDQRQTPIERLNQSYY